MGAKLFSDVAEATGLPTETISKELAELISAAGYSKETLTLDQLRHALAEYVQDILLEAKDDLNQLDEAAKPSTGGHLLPIR
jgi:hypothetical protein